MRREIDTLREELRQSHITQNAEYPSLRHEARRSSRDRHYNDGGSDTYDKFLYVTFLIMAWQETWL